MDLRSFENGFQALIQAHAMRLPSLLVPCPLADLAKKPGFEALKHWPHSTLLDSTVYMAMRFYGLLPGPALDSKGKPRAAPSFHDVRGFAAAARSIRGVHKTQLWIERVLGLALQRRPAPAKKVLGFVIKRLVRKSVSRIRRKLGFPSSAEERELNDVTQPLVELVTGDWTWRDSSDLRERLWLTAQAHLETRTIHDWDGDGSPVLYIGKLLGVDLISRGKYNGARYKLLLPNLFIDDLVVRPVLRCFGCGGLFGVSAQCLNCKKHSTARDVEYDALRRSRVAPMPHFARRCYGQACQKALALRQAAAGYKGRGEPDRAKGKVGVLHPGGANACPRDDDLRFMSRRTSEYFIESRPKAIAAVQPVLATQGAKDRAGRPRAPDEERRRP